MQQILKGSLHKHINEEEDKYNSIIALFFIKLSNY